MQIGLGIDQGDLVAQFVIVGQPDALVCHCHVGVRQTRGLQIGLRTHGHGLSHQNIALPVANRVAVIGWLNLVGGWVRPAIHEDSSRLLHPLSENIHLDIILNDLHGIGHGHDPRHALRQAGGGHVAGGFPLLRVLNSLVENLLVLRGERRRRRWLAVDTRLPGNALGILPNAREITLALRLILDCQIGLGRSRLGHSTNASAGHCGSQHEHAKGELMQPSLLIIFFFRDYYTRTRAEIQSQLKRFGQRFQGKSMRHADQGI